jgi:PAS domain S-box-containing protein
VVVNDVMLSPTFLPNPLLPATRSELAVPMIVGHQVIGVLDVQNDKENHFQEQDARILTTLADQIAVAVQNARSFRQVEEALASIDRIYSMSSDLIGSAGFDGYFRQLNPAWERVLGYSLDELKSQPFVSYVHPDDVEITQKEAAKIAEGAIALQFENRYRTKDGSYRWISWNSTTSPEEQMIYFVARDVTESKKNEEELLRRAVELQTVAEVSAQATTILQIQELLRNVVELTRERFNLYHVHIYLLDEARERLVLAAGAGEVGQLMVAQGHSIALDQELSLVAGAARERIGKLVNDVTLVENFLPNPLLPETAAEIAVPMLAGEQVIGVLDVQQSEADKFSQEDVRIMTTLADQIAVAVQNARLYEEQVQTAERLREVDRLKSEFLASMSHELRTPLNSIIGYAEVILDGLDGPINEEIQEDVNAIHGSGKLLLNLINDILDLAKIEAQQLELDREEIDLPVFLEEVIETSQIMVKDKTVVLELLPLPAELPIIYADPIRLRQILNNLISNAAKFTERGSIRVSVACDTENVAFQVVDTGIGVSEDKLALIFERFRQADQSSTRKAGGTGLGLAITKQLIEMHGGHIQVASKEGEGSTFAFTLPLNHHDLAAGEA